MSSNPTGTILIVEDEVSYWTHYDRKLAPLGFRVETAINPKEAETKLNGDEARSYPLRPAL